MNARTIIILPVAIILSACLPVNDNPKQVAHNYWTALKNNDYESARKLVSSNSQASLEAYINSPDSDKVTIDHVELDNEYASVASILNPAGTTADDNRSFDTILVLEKGKWKIDAGYTQVPQPKSDSEKKLEKLTEKLTESMQKNIDSLDDAMSEGMQLFNDVLREGSSEMGESLLEGMRDLNKNMRKSIDNMKERRKQKQLPAKDNGEGVL